MRGQESKLVNTKLNQQNASSSISDDESEDFWNNDDDFSVEEPAI